MATTLTSADTPFSATGRGSDAANGAAASAAVSTDASTYPPSARAAIRAATWTPLPL